MGCERLCRYAMKGECLCVHRVCVWCMLFFMCVHACVPIFPICLELVFVACRIKATCSDSKSEK